MIVSESPLRVEHAVRQLMLHFLGQREDGVHQGIVPDRVVRLQVETVRLVLDVAPDDVRVQAQAECFAAGLALPAPGGALVGGAQEIDSRRDHRDLPHAAVALVPAPSGRIPGRDHHRHSRELRPALRPHRNLLAFQDQALPVPGPAQDGPPVDSQDLRTVRPKQFPLPDHAPAPSSPSKSCGGPECRPSLVVFLLPPGRRARSLRRPPAEE